MTGARGPKSNSDAARRNAPKAGTALTGAKAVVPELDASKLTAATVIWWNAWAGSPQADRFADTDWMRLVMLVPLVEMYFTSPSPQLMAEIRQNEAKLGATAADRDRLGWKIDEPPAPGEKPPATSRDRKDPRA